MTITPQHENGLQCPVCHDTDVDIFFEIIDAPVHCNLLWDSKEDALNVPRGDIHLGFCNKCGHVYNTTFDPGKINYDQQYENALYFSNVFRDYAANLANYLVDRFDLHGKNVIDVGCGQGHFLSMLCHIGSNKGTGFDPGYRELASDSDAKVDIHIIKDFYSDKYKDYEADLVYSRQVLEHVPEPKIFIKSIHDAVYTHQTPVFIEVPNMRFTLQDLAVWDIIYEHYSYFTRESLTYLFQQGQFETQKIYDLYDGQFLGIEAIPVNGASVETKNEQNISEIKRYVRVFNRRFLNKKRYWLKSIRQWVKEGQSFILWGSGSKGVMFLNDLNIHDEMPYIIDINPRKQGKYVVGTGQKIMPESFLQEFKPEKIIIMNRIYKDEIQQSLKKMNIKAEVLSAT